MTEPQSGQVFVVQVQFRTSDLYLRPSELPQWTAPAPCACGKCAQCRHRDMPFSYHWRAYINCRCRDCRTARANVRAERAQRARRRAKGRTATRRAAALLRKNLSPQQQREWDRRRRPPKSFCVTTPTGRVFQRSSRAASNARFVSGKPYPSGARFPDWSPGDVLCVVFEGDGYPLPLEDLLLAQKLALETRGGERRFLTVAQN